MNDLQLASEQTFYLWADPRLGMHPESVIFCSEGGQLPWVIFQGRQRTCSRTV